MSERTNARTLTRRRFVQALGAVAIGGRTLLDSRDVRAAVYAARDAAGEEADWPDMAYRTLGRTGFRASRLVMGCGASLMFRSKDALLDAAFDAGVNVFDVGYRGYYRGAEERLSAFARKRRDEIFLISKAPAVVEDLAPDASPTATQARDAARRWSEEMDGSLAGLGVERLDAYYQMAAYNPVLVTSDELRGAFEQAKQAGKVSHLGLSTHRNAERVLLAAAESGGFDLAMIAITPGGWYDWESKEILPGSPPMTELRPVLEKARAAGIGLVGMKAARYLAGLPILGWWDKPDAFEGYYDARLRSAGLSPFQRSYAYVLAHGLDVVNADIGNFAHLQENVVAAATSEVYFA